MSKFVRVAAAAAAVLLVAGPASAGHTPPTEPFVPEYVERQVYLHCNGATKVSNVHATVDGVRVSWDDKKPTASFQSGAGCGTLDTFAAGTANHNPLYDFPIAGTFTGNIDNLTIRFWAIDASGSRLDNEFTVDLHLVIDGADVLKRPTLAYAPAVPSSTGIARLYEVTVTDIGLDSEADHEAEHSIELTAYSKFVDGSGITAWVYDASEIDSGLVFNDKTPATKKIARNVEKPPAEEADAEAGA